jgi:hypothetical protein
LSTGGRLEWGELGWDSYYREERGREGWGERMSRRRRRREKAGGELMEIRRGGEIEQSYS